MDREDGDEEPAQLARSEGSADPVADLDSEVRARETAFAASYPPAKLSRKPADLFF